MIKSTLKETTGILPIYPYLGKGKNTGGIYLVTKPNTAILVKMGTNPSIKLGHIETREIIIKTYIDVLPSGSSVILENV